ncbi:MAG: hypothetical protein VXW43_03690 [Pseudomonadota bacterium]|nr:hypothetical protein [Pseudomonadota bacterium]
MTKPLPFDRVFQDHHASDDRFPGFLLVNHGRSETVDPRTLAASYGQMTLRAIGFGLENLEEPEAAYPALFLARHTVELYLKGLVPDWEAQRTKDKTRHHIDYLVDILNSQLEPDYDEAEISALGEFLNQMSIVDPQAMAFRFRDGAKQSFRKEPLDEPEIWIDFTALRESLALIFEALDMLWLKELEAVA